uniref:Uncharacterized protein n=1 Tax=Fagus sylvatica TaxID=28930 RepID=A0A2N9FEX8_FAGSY
MRKNGVVVVAIERSSGCYFCVRVEWVGGEDRLSDGGGDRDVGGEAPALGWWVIVPKSEASLWADLWAIPATSGFETNRIGGRVRGPSPLIHQWIEFCLQAARALPFKQEVIPGASPSALESAQVEVPTELTKGKPRLDTNLIAGVPPPEILASALKGLVPLFQSTTKQ